jgi:hypothetical protein
LHLETKLFFILSLRTKGFCCTESKDLDVNTHPAMYETANVC